MSAFSCEACRRSAALGLLAVVLVTSNSWGCSGFATSLYSLVEVEDTGTALDFFIKVPLALQSWVLVIW
jgi:hypothetical protein